MILQMSMMNVNMCCYIVSCKYLLAYPGHTVVGVEGSLLMTPSGHMYLPLEALVFHEWHQTTLIIDAFCVLKPVLDVAPEDNMPPALLSIIVGILKTSVVKRLYKACVGRLSGSVVSVRCGVLK